jgi:hypothetical protein
MIKRVFDIICVVCYCNYGTFDNDDKITTTFVVSAYDVQIFGRWA